MDIKGAWEALRKKQPKLLPDQLALHALQDHSRLWPLLRYAFVPFIIGLGLILLMISGDAMRRVGSPSTSGLSVAEYVRTEEFLFHAGIEIGLAFLIASIVSFFIEATARREQTQLLNEAIRLVGNDVFQGVYRIRHDPSYVKAVVSTCLAIRHVRKGYEVDCTVSEFTQEERDQWGVTSPSLVKVDAEVTYFTENIANQDGEFSGRYFIPKRFEGAGNFARLYYLEVGNHRYVTDEEIESLELPVEHPDYVASDRGYKFPIPAKVRTPTKVHLRAAFAKERSDNEIYTFIRPTIGAKIKFRFNVPGLTIGMKAWTATGMDSPPEIVPGRSVFWEVTEGALLPNNHVIVWWQTADAAGAADDASGLTAMVETADLVAVEPPLTSQTPVEGDEGAGTAGGVWSLRALYKRARGAIRRLAMRARDDSG